MVYVHIPIEKGRSKLSDRGQRGRLIGIEGWGLYRIFIPETGAIIRSRNVKFEEGLGHRTLTAEGEYFKDNNNNLDLGFLNETTVTPAEEITQPSPNQLPNSMPASTQPTSQPRPRIVYPPASRKSTRISVPSRAANESEEYKSRYAPRTEQPIRTRYLW
jgi:hypothetical protein